MRPVHQSQRQPLGWVPAWCPSRPSRRQTPREAQGNFRSGVLASRSPRLSSLPGEPSRLAAPSVNPQELDAERFAGEVPAAPWSFSKISVLSSDRRTGDPSPSSRAAPFPPGAMQPKLAIGPADDPLEHEARRVAHQALRVPRANAFVSDQLMQQNPKSTTRAGAELQELQTERPRSPGAIANEPPRSVHEVLRAPGQPLDASVRAFMEPRFGHDFSRVRVHADAAAAESARSVNAIAYTAGSHVVFGAGQYEPGKKSGRMLLAHELTHTIQQQAVHQDDSGQAATLPILRQAADKDDLPEIDRSTEVLPQHPTDRRSQIQRGLDEFLSRMAADYRTPAGDTARVAPPFMMGQRGYLEQRHAAGDQDNKAHLASVKRSPRISQVIGRVQEGRGSPEEIRLVTQALIDDKASDKYTGAPEERIRKMMFDYRIGSDCAGYTQQAFLFATQTERGTAHFKDIGNEDLGESTPDLARRGFMRIDDPSAALPGDIVVLDVKSGERPPGHRAIVYSQREVPVGDRRELTEKLHSSGIDPALFMPAGATVYVLELDSSWGAGVDDAGHGSAEIGGVQRRTFWYSPAGAPKWAWTTDHPMIIGSGDLPYDHRLRGFYRLKTR
jgi:Domain of unknown function (DUF4157)